MRGGVTTHRQVENHWSSPSTPCRGVFCPVTYFLIILPCSWLSRLVASHHPIFLLRPPLPQIPALFVPPGPLTPGPCLAELLGSNSLEKSLLGGRAWQPGNLLYPNTPFSPRSFRRLYSLMLTLISLTASTALVKGTLSGWDSGVEFSNSISSSG